MSILQTIAEVSLLPPSDRLRVAEAIWDSLDESAIPLPCEGQLQLLEARLAEHDVNPSSGLSADEIERKVAELRKRP
jgi:putative addiction module component (TIGR02574 family)